MRAEVTALAGSHAGCGNAVLSSAHLRRLSGRLSGQRARHSKAAVAEW